MHSLEKNNAVRQHFAYSHHHKYGNLQPDLSSILTYQLHKDSADNMQQLALDLENSTIVVAALIPWSIACAVPLATVGAGNASILFAFYLYLLPLYNLWRPYKVTPV